MKSFKNPAPADSALFVSDGSIAVENADVTNEKVKITGSVDVSRQDNSSIAVAVVKSDADLETVESKDVVYTAEVPLSSSEYAIEFEMPKTVVTGYYKEALISGAGVKTAVVREFLYVNEADFSRFIEFVNNAANSQEVLEPSDGTLYRRRLHNRLSRYKCRRCLI